MIDYKTGDILKDDAEALVNTVNCVGIMGRGVALQFKLSFPENYREYVDACKKGKVQPGRMLVYDTQRLIHPRYIINFPTKRHWKGKSRIEDIEAGLKDLINVIHTYKLRSIALPPLGSGLGGLNWREVKTRIESALAQLDNVHITVYEPNSPPVAEKMSHSRKTPGMTPGRAALVALMRRYLEGLLDPFVTLLEVHKLMYFMQEAGEPLRLRFQKGPYGPYAENLRHVLHAVEGHLIFGYADGGDNPAKQLNLVPGSIQDADAFLEQHPETRSRLGLVSELVAGFESTLGMELLSTVHWVVNNEPVASMEDIVYRTYSWNDRKRQFTSHQIKRAFERIKQKGWVAGEII